MDVMESLEILWELNTPIVAKGTTCLYGMEYTTSPCTLPGTARRNIPCALRPRETRDGPPAVLSAPYVPLLALAHAAAVHA